MGQGPETFEQRDFALQRGGRLPSVQIVYQTYGALNADKSNAVLFPTWYSSQHKQNEWLIGPDKALDPRRWFIVAPNMLGNGLSSSPSNTPAPFDRARFPAATVYDNVMLQRVLLRERFGIERLKLVLGRSMGAMQAFHWGCLFPEAVQNLLAISGAARASPHNYVFLAGVKAALTADPAWRGGDYDTPPVEGIKAFGRVYAGWIYSQAWYRQHLYRRECDGTLEEFLAAKWDGNFLRRDANDLLCQLDAWQHGDLSDNPVYRGDFDRALGAITARSIVMPGRTDLYFPPEDSAYEVARMPRAELRVIESVWGHRSGSPNSDPADIAFIDNAIRDLLEDRVE
jgi:homoserine O-acetyltransferase/O-succinyltransferase